MNTTRTMQFAQKLANTFLGMDSVKVKQGNMGSLASVNVKTKEVYFDFPMIFGSPLHLDKLDFDDDADEEITALLKDPFNTMMVFKGLLFHELHHIKHTVNTKKFIQPRVRSLIGELEDGRIETLAVLKFGKIADYLAYPINNVLLRNKKQILLNKNHELIDFYILLYGRKVFLRNIKLLSSIRGLIVGNYGLDVAEKIEEVVDAYIFQKSSNKRVDLAEELYRFFLDKGIYSDHKKASSSNIFHKTKKDKNEDIDEETREMMDMAEELSKKLLEQIKKQMGEPSNLQKEREEFQKDKDKRKKDARDRMEEIDKEWDDEADKDTKKRLYEEEDELRSQIDEIDREQFQSKEVEDALEKAEEDAFRQETEEEEWHGGDAEQLKQSDNNAGSFMDAISKLKDKNEELVDDNLQDLKADLKAVGVEVDSFSDDSFDATPEMVEQVKALEKVFVKFNNDLKMGYVRGQKSGRLNVKRLMNRKNLADTKIFNKFKPDMLKKTKLLVNLYLDGSGSMAGHRWKNALESTWIFNELLNKDGNKVMIYQFGGDYNLVKSYDGLLSVPHFMNGNSTEPQHAINDSIKKIDAYAKANGFKNVIDIIVTDGYFHGMHQAEESIAKLNKMGHETIIIEVCNKSGLTYGVKHKVNIDSFDELADKMGQIFKNIKKNVVKNVLRGR